MSKKKYKNGQVPKLTSRTIYDAVKKYDRQQFDNFCASIYIQGFDNGRASVPGVDVSKVLEAIGEVKGIGAKKLEDIRERLEGLFNVS